MSLQALIYEPEAGETIDLRGTTVRVLCTEADGVGPSTFEFSAVPGFDTGSHFHSNMDEQFYVINGEMELRVGDRRLIGRPGTFVAVPAGVTHAFANRSDAPARMLLLATPAGHERYFIELAEILARPGRPDADEIAALRARFDTTQVETLST